MNKKNLKTISTFLIILISIVLFVAFIYIEAMNGKVTPAFIGILFAIIPALSINAIWNRKVKKKIK